jgi:putative FmdB family regulatory protein
MPLYDYQCPTCGKLAENVVRPMSEYKDGPICCDKPMRRYITSVRFNPVYGAHDMPGYQCPVSERWVDSRKQRREIMAEHNLIEKE